MVDVRVIEARVDWQAHDLATHALGARHAPAVRMRTQVHKLGERLRSKRVAIIVSGGNMTMEGLRKVLGNHGD